MKLVVSLCLVFFSLFCSGQTYSYSYIDPCTGKVRNVSVPLNGGATFSYYGERKTFSYDQILNGEFETWANSTFVSNKSSSPCSEVVGLGTAVDITQSQALNIIGIMNSLSTISDMIGSGSTDMLGGAMNSVEKSEEVKNKPNNNQTNNQTNDDNSNSSGSNTINNSDNSGSNSSSPNENNESGTVQSNGNGTQESNSNPNPTDRETGNSSNPTPNNQTPTNKDEGTNKDGGVNESKGTNEDGGTSKGGGNNEGGETNKEKKDDSSNEETSKGNQEKEGKTDITSGSTNVVKAALNKNGKPTIIASGDFVGFNFKNNSIDYGSKITGGYTSVKWDGTKTSGLLADYTSAIRGPNLTGFHAWLRTKATTLVSATMTFGFEGYGSQYGTLAVGELRTFKKIKKLKVAYLATFSFGKVYKTKFIGTALIAGAMYDIKLHKRLDLKLTNLFIYAPYVSYYNDIVMKSPYVMLPSAGFNIGITKRFKFNINVGGAWIIKENALNYTSTIGTRFIL
jgi:hypothetical protein